MKVSLDMKLKAFFCFHSAKFTYDIVGKNVIVSSLHKKLICISAVGKKSPMKLFFFIKLEKCRTMSTAESI